MFPQNLINVAVKYYLQIRLKFKIPFKHQISTVTMFKVLVNICVKVLRAKVLINVRSPYGQFRYQYTFLGTHAKSLSQMG